MGQKLYEENNIQAIANAIREKNGSIETYKVSEMAAAIAAIETGGGGGLYDDAYKQLVTGTLVNFVAPEGTKNIRSSLFYNYTLIQTADLRNTTDMIGSEAFRGCTALKTVILPTVMNDKNTPIKSRVFHSCSSLERIETELEGGFTSATPAVFQNCTGLKHIDMPNYSFGSSNVCSGCSSLEFVRCKGNLGANAFTGCINLKEIVMTSTTGKTNVQSTTFANTPFSDGSANLTVYVHNAFIEDYKNDTTWKIYIDMGSITLMPIEGSKYE